MPIDDEQVDSGWNWNYKKIWNWHAESKAAMKLQQTELRYNRWANILKANIFPDSRKTESMQ
jgi:hypothetical protein